MLRKAGIEPAHTVALPDHAPFDELPPDIRNAKTLLCTEKDAVKLWRHRPDAWAVRLELQLPDAFWDKFDRTLRERAGAKLSSGHGHKTA
jgi:tetraacyldisaccharide 4'-kinase